MLVTLNFMIFIINISTVYFYNKNYISNYFIKKYDKWLSLNNLVSNNYNSKLMIEIISLKVFFKSLYLSFIQYMNNSIVKIDKNSYQLSYSVNGKLYKMIIKPIRGPIPILSITNENNIDITDEIIPYLGPNNDWHGKKYYPDFFNQKILIIELLDGTKKTFIHSDTILI